MGGPPRATLVPNTTLFRSVPLALCPPCVATRCWCGGMIAEAGLAAYRRTLGATGKNAAGCIRHNSAQPPTRRAVASRETPTGAVWPPLARWQQSNPRTRLDLVGAQLAALDDDGLVLAAVRGGRAGDGAAGGRGLAFGQSVVPGRRLEFLDALAERAAHLRQLAGTED